MICSYCGAKNSATREKCFNCGRPLDSVSSTSIDTQSIYTTDKADAEDNFYKEASEEDFIPRRVTKRSAPTPSPARLDKQEARQQKNARRTQQPPKKIEAKEKKPLDKFSIAIIILAIVFASVLAVTGVLVYNNYFKEQELGNGSTAADLGVASPKVEVLTDSSGEQYALVTFYGTVGDRLYFACDESYSTFVSTTVEKKLYLSDVFAPDKEFKESTASFDIGAAYVRDSKHYAYNLSPITLSLLPAELDIARPSEKNLKSYDDTYTIKMWAQPGSTVVINGVDVSKKMDPLGNIRHDIETKANAITTCYIEVSHPYRTPAKDSFIISRDAVDINFKITKVSISGDTCTITATGPSSAKITADLPVLSSSHNDLYNNFTIKLDLSNCPYGETFFVLTAETADGKATRTSSVMYWPSEASSTQASRTLTASTASSPTKGAQYVISNATITRALSANTFEVSTKIDNKTYYFAIKYENNITPLEIGAKYKFFVAGTGTNDESGLPILKAWYIYPL